MGPCNFVIFGAAGHLSTTKLLPALYHLEAAGRLNEALQFIAFARRDWDNAVWRERLIAALDEHVGAALEQDVLNRFADRFAYVKGDHTDAGAYRALLDEISKPRPGVCENIVLYLAIRPADFVDVIGHLDTIGLNSVIGRHRIVVEKPFGTDLGSAEALNAELHRHFGEDQIYRIDHYLGKETVQNLLVFRFANSIIEPVWNRNHIDHVQITVAESAGIGARAGYFDHAGTLRDMVQNHLLQLLTVVAMEPPSSLEADALRDEKVKVLRSVRPIPVDASRNSVVRGQYDGYLDESGVAAGSATETFVALKLAIDNWRWTDVPFYLRTGKRLATRRSLIAIRFRHPPQQLFHDTPCEDLDANWLVLAIQPEESMRLQMYARQPGLGMSPRLVQLDTDYRRAGEAALDAYETLLLDVIKGDRSLFIRFDEVEAAWRVVDPVMRAWSTEQGRTAPYAPGSWGPREAETLLENPRHAWRSTP